MPGTENILLLGVVAVFNTAKSAASAEANKAAHVVTKVPNQRPHDITSGSCSISLETKKENDKNLY